MSAGLATSNAHARKYRAGVIRDDTRYRALSKCRGGDEPDHEAEYGTPTELLE